MLLADIASGHSDVADVFFLIAVILAAIAVLAMLTPTLAAKAAAFGWAAVTATALGLLLL